MFSNLWLIFRVPLIIHIHTYMNKKHEYRTLLITLIKREIFFQIGCFTLTHFAQFV